MTSSMYCDDQYVSEVLLENQKDRVVVIFGVYLQVGRSYLIEIHNFEDEPLHLKPYESFRQEYGPIERYEINLYSVDFNNLLDDKQVKKRLVLSTSEGRYTVRKYIKRWHPVTDHFRNHFAAVARPIHVKYKDKNLGSRIRYVVEFISGDGTEEVVPIHPSDHKVKKFRSFSLTKDSLQSKDSLEGYLDKLKQRGIINCAEIKVFDVDEWRQRIKSESLPRKSVNAAKISTLKFYVVGPVATWYSSWTRRRKNRKARIASKSAS